MTALTITAEIAAPREVVFDVFTNFAQAAEHVKGIEKIEVLTPGPVGVGTKFRETRIIFKKQATEEMEVTEFEPGERFTLVCQSCGCRYTTVHTFTSEGAGAKVQMDMQVEPLTFFARLMSPLGKLMMGSMKKCIAADVEDLKNVAEARAEEINRSA